MNMMNAVFGWTGAKIALHYIELTTPLPAALDRRSHAELFHCP
jgi:hypothetical protein